ncbi:MAG: hypothetical protein ACTSUF_03365 [Candidatus Heimdallarchaeaceae archaeon]
MKNRKQENRKTKDRKQKSSVVFSGKLGWDNQFKKAIEIASNLINEAYLNFDKNGITIKEVFNNYTGLLDISINKKDFERYFLPDPPLKIAVNLQELLKALKCAGSCLTIEIIENRITIRNDSETFKIPILSEISNRQEINEDNLNLKFEKTIKLKASNLQEIISKTQKFLGSSSYGGNTIVFSVNNLYLTATTGDETKQAEFKVGLASGIKKHQKPEKSVVSAFGDNLLKDILKAKRIEEEVELSFGNDQPLRAEFTNGTASARFIVCNMVREN